MMIEPGAIRPETLAAFILHSPAVEGSDLTLLGFDDSELTKMPDDYRDEPVRAKEAPTHRRLSGSPPRPAALGAGSSPSRVAPLTPSTQPRTLRLPAGSHHWRRGVRAAAIRDAHGLKAAEDPSNVPRVVDPAMQPPNEGDAQEGGHGAEAGSA
jgi:hypothetical protein